MTRDELHRALNDAISRPGWDTIKLMEHIDAYVATERHEIERLRGQRARLDDMVAEYRKREEAQDRIRERLTEERDEAIQTERERTCPDCGHEHTGASMGRALDGSETP